MRVVVCGEALVDLVAQDSGSDPSQTQIASKWLALCGGGPMNTAVALSRLQVETLFAGTLGDDVFAKQLDNWLICSGVDTSLARRMPGTTALALASVEQSGPASYAFHLAQTATFQWHNRGLDELDEDTWLHFGSLAAVVGPGAEAIRAWAAEAGLPLSFDLNVRPSVIPDQATYWNLLQPWLELLGSHGGILRASADDLAWLVGETSDTSFDAIEVAADWARQFSIGLVALTLGDQGAAAVKGDGRVTRVRGPEVDVVDTIGAGDTFTAGFLSAWLADPSDLEAALACGAAAAALTCSRAGANPPNRAELNSFTSRRGRPHKMDG